jgi:predicted hydrocarbon binding protein
MPVRATEVAVKMTDTLRTPDLCAFASGLFEQLVVLSSGRAAHVEHEACEARGDQLCLYRVSWERTT